METIKKRLVRPTRRKTEAAAQTAPQKLELLVAVVARSKAEFYMDLLQSFEVNMQTALTASGTASADMLHYLGTVASERTVILSVIREDRIKDALNLLEDKFRTIKNGNGIAFTVPMSGTVGVALYRFLCNNRTNM